MKIVDKIRNKMGQNPESEEYIEEVDNTDDSDLQATTYQNPDNYAVKLFLYLPISIASSSPAFNHPART